MDMNTYCQFSAPRASVVRLALFAILGLALIFVAPVLLWRAAKWMFA